MKVVVAVVVVAVVALTTWTYEGEMTGLEAEVQRSMYTYYWFE